MTIAAAGCAAPIRDDLIKVLMTAWAMDETCVLRTIRRTAQELGESPAALVESHVSIMGRLTESTAAGA